MRIVSLMDDVSKKGFLSEHGLSIYVEFQGKKYLIDAGSTPLFLENAEKKGIDLSDVDYAFLSHAHYDHVGGFSGFFEKNQKAKVYLRKESKVCRPYVVTKEKKRYIGIPDGMLEKYADRFLYVSEGEMVDGNVYVLGHSTPNLQERAIKAHMYCGVEEGNMFPDNFMHEQSVVFRSEKGLVVINSCCHGGVANIVREVNAKFPKETVVAMIGGFHMMGTGGVMTMSGTEQEVLFNGRELKNLDVTKYYSGHCTGKPAFQILKTVLGDRLQYFAAGEELQI